MISHTCSIGERSCDAAGQCNMSTFCRACWVTTAVCYPVGKRPLNVVHEWQHNRLNHQIDVQISNQGVWDKHESSPAVIGNCSPDSRCRSSVSKPQTSWLQALTCLPSNQHTAITGTNAEPAFIRKHNRFFIPFSNEL
ncbi:hypothetical protein AVEN_62310-1 [Araneus ventricosus]|uniref:Uncharacterized protein n=1 Tax=Araneus ventricosus TaxID=182803 RepID=A0A4Y2KU18_ARAVE|nr:hypothetical protein AVEN_62310-1 [Araneus ventricosus]